MKVKDQFSLFIVLGIIILLVASGIFIIMFSEEEKPVKEKESLVDTRVSPLTEQGLFFEVNRIRRKGIIDQMQHPNQFVNRVYNLGLDDRGWIKKGEFTGHGLVTVLEGMIPGRGWDEIPSFTFETLIDDFSWRAEKTRYNTWDTGYIDNTIIQKVDEEQKMSEITFTIIEFVTIDKLFGSDVVEQVGESFTITYDYRTGRWTGDDSCNDSDGYGHFNGSDVEIWFDVRQTDFDGDGIPYNAEVNELHTDPRVDDRKTDFDDDGIPTSWEWKWGYDPKSWDNHSSLDPDDDGLQNTEEFMMKDYGANPFQPEIYIEVDYSAKAPFKPYKIEMKPGRILPFNRPTITNTDQWGQEFVFWEESQQMIMDRFNEHGISVHIDDGCMGEGGDTLPFISSSAGLASIPHLISGIYKDYFPEDRVGVFRYLIIGQTGGWTYAMDYRGCYDTMVVGHSPGFYRRQTNWAITDRTQRIGQATAVMHEMGHTLGIGYLHCGGVDNISREAFVEWYDYQSCMNYFWYAQRLFDYSDGSHGEKDVDDWALIDVGGFQRTAAEFELEGVNFDNTEPPYYRGKRGV